MINLRKTIFVENITLDEVFEKIYNSKTNNLSPVYEIKEWEVGEWNVKKGVMQKKEDIYIYVGSMPEKIIDYINEDEKYLRMIIKHKIKKNGSKYKKIKSSFTISNFKSIYKKLIKCFALINVVNTVEIIEHNDKIIEVCINTRININLPDKETYEKYVNDIFTNIIYNIEKNIYS
jgi:hypothetical protein